jgi:hypothetical protein
VTCESRHLAARFWWCPGANAPILPDPRCLTIRCGCLTRRGGGGGRRLPPNAWATTCCLAAAVFRYSMFIGGELQKKRKLTRYAGGSRQDRYIQDN